MRERVHEIWAAYVRRHDRGPWRLEAVSVLGPERARAMAEREHARECVVGAEFRLRCYADLREVPDQINE
jgi:hypothetical protein